MNPESPTPMTDARIESLRTSGLIERFTSEGRIVSADFARQLERELNAAQADSRRLREALQFIADVGGKTTDTEHGPITGYGNFCAEQARAALANAAEKKT